MSNKNIRRHTQRSKTNVVLNQEMNTLLRGGEGKSLKRAIVLTYIYI